MVEGDAVMFETGLGPHHFNDSDGDDQDETDMVVYNKDDMTNFSKSLGLNKLQSRLSLVNWRKPQDKLLTDEVEDEEAHFESNAHF